MQPRDFVERHHVTVLPQRITEIRPAPGGTRVLWSITYLYHDLVDARPQWITLPWETADGADERVLGWVALLKFAQDYRDGKSAFTKLQMEYCDEPAMPWTGQAWEYLRLAHLRHQFEEWLAAASPSMQDDFEKIEE